MKTFDDIIYLLKASRFDWNDDTHDKYIHLAYEYLMKYLQDGVYNHRDGWDKASQISHLYRTGNEWTSKQRFFLYKFLIKHEQLLDPLKAYA